ncbi:ketose-bisphosphate aldolase [Sediminispirochaeta smaragdinae]|uniref:Ketose-bisphosphate aldolase n=1 Tax=Sediminispirochaeta smaragdinae (strain DSM 11293 / JCM 15392 / SEBR 4228) TaxID=573413 RepID=E1R2C3_SEDSS|nr:ketose-bisphosphate aldolase [Sediminispirochaeta smaragdinae]ADK82483.1 ketose-bisphosphate aldolase [Sediminispirochaeta smaragdinae DSM 11293]
MLMTMKELLGIAKKHNFAVPAFNTSSSMILNGLLEACEEKQAPVIVAIHPDELEFVRDSFLKFVIDEAHKASFPVCIHLDHGASFDQVMRAIQVGFTSVMIDSSALPFEKNVEVTQKVVEAAHAVNVSVEAELGTIGGTGEGGIASTDNIIFTQPEDVKAFVEATDVDTLAIAIGTGHGLYPKDVKPKLRIDLLKKIRAITEVPLVLHGGSDNPDSEIAEAVKNGVQKINISSDIKTAFYKKCREVLQDQALREPGDIYPPCIAAMKQVMYHKIDLFNDADKVKFYK